MRPGGFVLGLARAVHSSRGRPGTSVPNSAVWSDLLSLLGCGLLSHSWGEEPMRISDSAALCVHYFGGGSSCRACGYSFSFANNSSDILDSFAFAAFSATRSVIRFPMKKPPSGDWMALRGVVELGRFARFCWLGAYRENCRIWSASFLRTRSSNEMAGR